MRIFLASIFFVAACGGAASEPAEPTPGPAAETHEHADQPEEHPQLTPELHAYHETLAPLWHDESAERQAKTCAAVGDLVGKGAAVGPAGAPATVDANAWQTAVARFDAANAQLQTVCGGTGDFAAAFHEVHEAFHALLDMLPAPDAAAAAE